MSEENKTLEIIEVAPIDTFDIDAESAFPPLGEPNEQLRHTLLNDRDIPDQHPITAITGLREELNDIKSLKPIVADKIGVANYYAWSDGSARDEFGYFVSLVPHTTTIQICEGTDVFGVTVEHAGFIGGEDEKLPRNKTYALVATSGLVDVRCESDVEDGDYIIANAFGVAEKTTSGCGYKVVAKENKHGVDYVVISLGVQACTTDAISRNVQRLGERMDDAETNIGAAMNTANLAYNKAVDTDIIAEEVKKQMQEAIDKVDEMQGVVDSANNSVTNTSAIAAQARAIAESASTAAITLKDEAIEKANDAWMRADEVATEVYSLCANIDKYSVGEYSQAYGLTLEQAQSILKPGMIYIPTPHGDTHTHTESYEGSVDREFTSGFWYEWNGITWSENLGNVWINTEPPVGDSFDYWYDGTRLYIIQDDEWTEVATLAGNANNRITSMIRQEVGKINLEVVNARGSFASLSGRIDEAESIVQTTAQWTKGQTADGDELYNIATIKQSATDDGANLALVVADVSGNKILNGASIVLGSNDEGSSISFDADCINFDTGNFKLTADYIDLDGYATINDGFRIDKDGYMHATKGGSIGGFDIYDYNISSTPLIGTVEFHINSGEGDAGGDNWISAIYGGETTFKVTQTGILHATGAVIEGNITATEGKIGQCEIDENGNLQIKNANIAEKLTADSIDADSLTVGNILVKNEKDKLLLSASNNTVQIGGWNVDSNSLYSTYSDSASRVFMCTGTSSEYKIGGYTDKWYFGAGSSTGPGFGVSTSGVLYASGAEVSGTIKTEYVGDDQYSAQMAAGMFRVSRYNYSDTSTNFVPFMEITVPKIVNGEYTGQDKKYTVGITLGSSPQVSVVEV